MSGETSSFQKKRVYERVYDHLKQEIIENIHTGVLSPGDGLASEKRLSEMLDVSVTSVQRALKELQEEGWIFRRQRRGTFVAMNPPHPGLSADKGVVRLFQPSFGKDLQNLAFFPEIVIPFEEYLVDHGVEVQCAPVFQQKAMEFIEHETSALDVAVVVGGLEWTHEIVKDLSVPCLFLADCPRGETPILFDTVKTDDLQAGYVATQHLISLGHERIAHIGGGRSNTCAQERSAGYQRALNEAGIRVEPGIMDSTDWTIQSGYEAMLKILATNGDVTGVFAAGDPLALGAIRALSECGKRVPDDVSVIGFDDYSFSKHLVPSLTTMRTDRPRIGSLGAQLVLRRLREPDCASRKTLLPAVLIERDSVIERR
ncbi:MAG: substrate-binding domain-containing protein [Nitrospiraceae bacterium]|nr:substrate-binding domain-containing protein [Nitrospiraceae bacterium]